MPSDPTAVPRPMLLGSRPTDLTPEEFELFVVELFRQMAPDLENLRITHGERVVGLDGTFAFDATVRYRMVGLDFVVVVEAKRHKNPIKRDVVQSLLSKVESVGAQKGVLVSTAPFQSGAIEFARVHGLALIYVADEIEFVMRSTVAIPSADDSPRIAVARCWSLDADGQLHSTMVSKEAATAAEILLPAPRSWQPQGRD